MDKKEFVCKFCNKEFPSGKSLGGHIRIHSISADNNGKKKKKNKKRLVDQREITPLKQQTQCRVCGKSFCSLRALDNHMDCHNYEGEKMVMGMGMDTHSASETTSSSGPTMIKRSKKEHSNSESFSTVSASSDVVEGAKDLMFYHLGRKEYNFNSLLPDSSENNSEILETKSSSGDKVAVDDNLGSPAAAAADDDDSSDDSSSDSDSDSDSDYDYFMNGPKKSESYISVGGSLRNTGGGSGFNSFKSGDELRNKEGRSKDELRKSKRVSPFYESDLYEDKFSDGMVKKASGANRNSKGHKCPVCHKVYSSGQALGGHKRSHNSAVANQQLNHRGVVKDKAADMQFDLDLPAEE